MLHRVLRTARFMEAFISRIAGICLPMAVLLFIVCLCCLSPLLAILFAVFLIWPILHRQRQTTSAHGTASWAGTDDLIEARCLSPEDGLPLGHAVGLSPLGRCRELKMLLSWPLSQSRQAADVRQQRQRRPPPLPVALPDRIPHVGIYGASGSMKTTAFAVQQLLQCQCSTVVLDPKGELSRLTAKHRARRGHRIVLIDPYDVAEGCGYSADRFNPLLLYRDDSTRIVDDARRLANAMIVRTGKESDEFWPNASSTVLTAILAFLMALTRKEESNLSRLRDILSSPALIDQMLTMMAESDACNGLLARAAGQVQQLEGKTRSSVLSVAGSHTDFLDSVPLATTVLDSTFDPHELITGQMTIYVCLPVQRLQELMGIQRVIISTLINLVFEAGEDRHRRVRFLLDEAASLGPMDSLFAMIMFGRSYGLRSSLLFQSMSQIDRCFPDTQKDDFLGTTASVICGATDIATAKLASEWMGNFTDVSQSDQSGYNWGQSTNEGIAEPTKTANWGGNHSASTSEVSRPLLRPEEVLQMPPHLGIVLLPNVRPILIEKVPWFMRHSRRLLSRWFSLVSDLIVIAFTLTMMPVMLWAFTIGRSHPLVQEFLHRILNGHLQ